ncbi:MAG: tyrosine-type recombinase/integrase [Candidatus Eisenbacteria sp.]|nr:tyrosine-type recombinase/integrase [Candidatus Eisenbacteria bacterium]
MLMKAVDSYLSIRRAAGFELEVPEYLLRSFARFATGHGETHVTTRTAIEWASQAPSLSQRDHRLKTVIRMARHLKAEDERHEVPPNGVFGYRKTRRVPFLYTQTDINRLIQAASQLGPPGSLRPHTYSTLLALLSVTGLRISEALALCLGDVTADGLIIRRTKFQKSRLAPLHETTDAGLERYLVRRRRAAPTDDHVFISLQGTGLSRSGVQWTFRNLLKTIGLEPKPGGRRPRIHDLRHGFAIRVLEDCPEGRDNVGRHMLALSTYLGHANISDTYWYLEATPNLMRDIADASEAFLKGDRL